MDERTRRELATTRLLYIIWGLVGVVAALVLCYLLYSMLRLREPQAIMIGRVEDFPPDSVTLKYVNAKFSDPETKKDFTTLSLEVVRDSGGNFTIFFARSTDPAIGGLTPRQCVVEWDDASQRFVEPCGGAKWTRDGKYVTGPAPRDLDRFPAQIANGDLTIRPELTMGAAHP